MLLFRLRSTFNHILLLLVLFRRSEEVVFEKCVDYGNNYAYSEACHEITLDFDEADVDMENFQEPEGFDLKQAVHNLTEGSGYYVVRKLFSQRDVEVARDRVLFYENPYAGARRSPFVKNAEFHNNYHGLLWGLLNKGRIFEKMAQHPTIVSIARKILGQNAQISSLAANTVLPGMMSQKPHLDYPYYDYLFPSEENAMATNHLLSLQFVTLLTNFTIENGGTAIRPNSHIIPKYPTDEGEFFDNAIQIEGDAGDMVVFAGPIQHCAMVNKAREFRTGILQHMVPVYVKLIVLLIGTIGCTIACSVTVVIPVAMIIIGAVHFDDCPAEPYIPVFLIVGGTFLVAKYIIGVAARFRQGRRQLERQQQQHQQQQEMQQVHPCDREAGVGDNSRDPIRGATVHVFEEGGGGGSVSGRRDDERSRRRGRRRNTSSDDGDGEQGEEEVDPLQSIISCFLCAWFITGCVWVYRIYEPVMDPALSGDPHYCDATVYVFAFWFITTAYIFLGLVTSCICCISIYAQTRTEREQ